jgi:hypothetical protein
MNAAHKVASCTSLLCYVLCAVDVVDDRPADWSTQYWMWVENLSNLSNVSIRLGEKETVKIFETVIVMPPSRSGSKSFGSKSSLCGQPSWSFHVGYAVWLGILRRMLSIF